MALEFDSREKRCIEWTNTSQKTREGVFFEPLWNPIMFVEHSVDCSNNVPLFRNCAILKRETRNSVAGRLEGLQSRFIQVGKWASSVEDEIVFAVEDLGNFLYNSLAGSHKSDALEAQ